MSGVEILATNEIVSKTVFNGKLALIIFIACFLFFALCGIVAATTEHDPTLLGLLVLTGIGVGGVLGGLLGLGCGIPIEYITEYKVTISEEVSLSEFIKEYEVIDQEGRIFTVRERTEE